MARTDALLRLHKALLARRAELNKRLRLTGDSNNLHDFIATDSVGDTADAAFERESDEVSGQLQDLEACELTQVEHAMARLKEGAYGICAKCSGNVNQILEGIAMNSDDGLTVPPALNGRHRHTYEAIFRHPAAHNLEWHDVRSLLEALGEVADGEKGSLQVKRNGQSLHLRAPKHKDVAAIEDLMAIRHFLEKSGEAIVPTTAQPGIHLLVVIDHHEANIYRAELQESIPQRLVPYDPHGFGRHLRSDTPETDGKRKPERKSFYEAIAGTLRGAEKILIFGSGTGESSAMDHLLADLKQNHRDVAEKIVGSIVVDEHHRTEGQLLAQAREFFASKSSS